MLAEFGTIIPDEVEVRVHDSTAMVRYLASPQASGVTAQSLMIDGGAGLDLADYSAVSGNMAIDLVNGTAQDSNPNGVGTDVLRNMENITAGSGNDAAFLGPASSFHSQG